MRRLKRRRMRKKVISAYYEARSVEKNMGATKIQLMWRRKMQENEKIRSRMGKGAQLKQLLAGKSNAKNMQYQHIIIIQSGIRRFLQMKKYQKQLWEHRNKG